MARPKKERQPPPDRMTIAQRVERSQAIGQQLILGDGGLVRTKHPPLENRIEQIVYLSRLLTSGLFQPDRTHRELQEDWHLGSRAVGDLLADARKQIALRGDASYVRDIVHDRLATWIDEADAKDRVPAAKLWLQSSGALKNEVTVVSPEQQMSDEQIARQAIEQLIGDEMSRAMMRQALADWDAKHTLGPIEVLSCKPTDHNPEAAEAWNEIVQLAEAEEREKDESNDT